MTTDELQVVLESNDKLVKVTQQVTEQDLLALSMTTADYLRLVAQSFHSGEFDDLNQLVTVVGTLRGVAVFSKNEGEEEVGAAWVELEDGTDIIAPITKLSVV